MEEKVKRNKSSLIWLIVVCFIAVGLLLFCQFYFGSYSSGTTTFYPNTHINGVDVSGLTVNEANEKLSQNLIDNKDNVVVTVKSGDKTWQLLGSDFEIVGNFDPTLTKILQYGQEGNI